MEVTNESRPDGWSYAMWANCARAPNVGGRIGSDGHRAQWRDGRLSINCYDERQDTCFHRDVCTCYAMFYNP